nr:hypothetical protein [uncultured Treponema sp.]
MKKKFLTLFTLLLSFVLILTGCEVGLGEAVDTEPPVLSINYPPAASTIRDSFVIAGTCEDDKGVTKVTVDVRNTDMNKSFGSYSAKVDGTKWSLELNGSGGYNGWSMPDGRYVAEAKAYDATGRSSGVSSLSFDIDNTAPLFILSSPGNDTLDGSVATKFGSTYKLAGTIAEDHTVSKIKVTVKAADGTVKGTFSRSNVEIAGGTEIVFAEKGNTKEKDDDGNTLDANYRKIYGNYDTESGQKLFYCDIEVSDSAQKYTQKDSDSTAGGNTTSKIYFYDDVYSAWLSTASGLDATKAKKIINGTYTGEFVNGSFTTPKLLADGSLLRTASGGNDLLTFTDGKEAFNYVRNSLFREKIAFSLNPDADPTYSVIGYNINRTDVLDGTASYTTAFSSQQITVQAVCGLNGYGVKPASLKVYQFGPYELADLKASLLDSIYGSNASMIDYYNAHAVAVNPANDGLAILIGDNSSSQEPSAESCTFAPMLDGSIKGNKYYILAVSGEDSEGQFVKTNAGKVVIFKGELAGTPPKIVINPHAKADAATVTPDDQAIIGTGEMSFAGTIDEGSSDPTMKFSVTVSDADDGTIVGSFEKSFDYDKAAKTWSFKLTDSADYIETPKDKYYLYDVIVRAENNGGTQEKERKIFVDTIDPVITINSITPECTKEGDENKFLNGTFRITGKAEDTNLETVWYEIKSNGDPIVSSLDFTDKDAKENPTGYGQWYSFNNEITIDSTNTLKFNTKNNKDLEIVIHAKDKAGNEGTLSTTQYLNKSGKTYKIDQSTDNPVITGNNFVKVTDTAKLTANAPDGSTDSGNVFDTTSNHNLMFTVTDDDGIASVKVICVDKNGTETSTTLGGLANKPTTASLTYKNLPLEAGICSVTIIARDSTYSDSLAEDVKKYRETTYGPFYVAIDKENPVLTETAAGADTQYANAAKTITYSGAISDDFKLADSPLSVLVKNPDGKYIKADGTEDTAQKGITITPNADGTWTYSFKVPAKDIDGSSSSKDGMYELSFTARDNFGRQTTVSRNVIKDTTKPQIKINSVTPTVTSGTDRLLNGTFNVTGSVTEKYLDTVWYEIKSNDGTKDVTVDSRDLKHTVNVNNVDTEVAIEGQWYSFNSEIEIDSTNISKFKAYDNKEIEVVVHAKDKSGNEETYSTTTFFGGKSYKVLQSSDKPVITGNNFAFIDAIGDDEHSADDNKANLSLESDLANGKGNIFDASTNRKIIGTITDDDGIKNIYVYIRKEDGTEFTSQEMIEYGLYGSNQDYEYTGFTEGTTTTNFNYQLPSKAGIYQVTVNAVDVTWLNATGSTGVTVDQVRANRRAELGPFFVAVDDKAPELTETAVNSTDTKYIREDDPNTSKDDAAFTFSGNVSDDWGVASLAVSVKYIPASGNTTSLDALKALGGTITPAANGSWSKTISFKNASYTYGAGLYEITFTATDKAGRQSSVVRNVYKDTVAPVFGTSGITDPKDSNYSETNVKPYISTVKTNGWFNTNTLRVEGGVSDAASGVKKVEYTLNASSQNPTWNELSGTSLFSGTIPSVENGGTITIRATDVAGNYVDTGISGIMIDTGMPGAVVTEIDGETTGLGTKLSNGKEKIVIKGTATDALSGIETIKINVGDKVFTSPAVTVSVTRNVDGSINTNPFTQAKDAGGNAIAGTYLWIAEIPAAKLTSSGTVWAQVIDAAGNAAEVNLFALQVDTVDPSAEFNSTLKGATVNKVITISGTANDDQKLDSIKLEYQSGVKTESGKQVAVWTEVTANGALDGTKVSGTYNWSLTGIDSQKAFGTTIYDCDSSKDGDQVNLRVTAIDAAGNSKSEITYITVDQNTDRPVITFTNLNPLDGMSPTNYLFFNNTKMMGNLSDDDGIDNVVLFKIITRPVTNGVRGDAPTLDEFRLAPVVPLSSGSWNYTLNSQGKQDIYFYVKDAKGTEFISKAAGNDLTSVYLKDETNLFGTSQANHVSTVLYIRIDTVDPELKNLGFNFYSKKDNMYIKDADVEWETSVADQIFGGNTSKFAIRLDAIDANGIASVVGKIDSNTYTFTKKSVDSENNGTYLLTDIPMGGTSSTGNRKDGVNYFTIEITDNAGRTRSTTLTLDVDNTLPVVKVSNPTSQTTVSGNVSAYGTVDEAADMYYAISTSATVSPDDTATAITSYTDSLGNSVTISDIKDKISYSELKGAALSWYIYFDGDSDPSQTVAHDARILNNYLTYYGITTDAAIEDKDNPFDTIVKLYLWVKAVDKAGNVTEVAHEIKLDPQGDRPTITINYPEKDGDTLGGNIKVYGEANDNIAVKTAWLQVISKKNHPDDWDDVVAYSGDKPSYNVTKFEPTKDDLDFLAENGYSVYLMSSYDPLSGSNAAWKKGTSTIATGKTAADYGILANSSGSTWNVKINVKDELNPAKGSTTSNVIAIRAFARDDDGKVSIPSDRIFEIDSDKPVFGSSQPFYLVQSADVSWSTATTASREYSEDMYVKGSWYLIGSVEDDVGIKSLTLRDNTDAITKTMIEDKAEKSGGADFDVEISGKVAYFKVKLPTASGVGSIDYTFTAEDIAEGTAHSQTKDIKINFDNNAPVLIKSNVSGYNINPSVKQSNNFYVFGSNVKEDAVTSSGTTVNQSGFDYVAFYFMRRSDKTTDNKDYIYDIMQPRQINDGGTLKENAANKVLVSSLTYEDGIYWKTYTVTRSDEHLGLLKLDAKDDNIHVGGLCKIGGAAYLITSISSDGKEIEVNGNIPKKYTAAKFACAMVVNNTVQETESGTLQTDGYYQKPANDDGDRMIESVIKNGSTWSWEADICSKNIPDGPIELHYVAFDKAGNYNIGIVGCVSQTDYKKYKTPDVNSNASVYAYDSENPGFVSNNQPRIAGVIFGSDDNANGVVDPVVRNASGKIISTGEMNITYGGWYNAADPYGNKKTGVTVNGKEGSRTITTFNIPEQLDSAALTIKGETKIIPEIVGGNNGLKYTYSVTKNGESTPYFNSVAVDLSSEDSITDDVRENIEINLTTVNLLTPVNSKTIADGQMQKFEFKIWDKTEGTTAGTNSQYATINLIANVLLHDNQKANAWFKPFYWKWNETTKSIDSSVYEDDLTQGHIELEADWKLTEGTTGGYMAENADGYADAVAANPAIDADPKVSGKISMRGTAKDNVCVNEIWIKVHDFLENSSDTENRGHIKIAKRITAEDGTEENPISDEDLGNWTSLGTMEDDGWEFELDGDEIFDQAEGNTVNFVFSWDTSKIDGVASYDVEVEVFAKDKGSITLNADKSLTYATTGPSAESTTQTGTLNAQGVAQLTPYYKMDVVPYITKVTTSLSTIKPGNPTVYSRTAKGHYPIRSDETVTLNGFNLAADNASVTASAPSSSGNYVHTVNGVSTLNNINVNNACGTYGSETGKAYTDNNYAYCYNRQPNGDNNYYLTDDIVFDVWQFDNENVATVADSGYIQQPVMKINPANDMIGFAFANGAAYASLPKKDTSSSLWQRNYARNTGTSFAYDANGDSHGTTIGLDTNPSSSHAGRMTYMTSIWGPGDTGSQEGNYNGTNTLRIEAIGAPKGTYAGKQYGSAVILEERFPSTSIAVASHVVGTGKDAKNVPTVYLAYYDDLNQYIRFRWGVNNKSSKDGFNQFLDQTVSSNIVFEPKATSYSVVASTTTTYKAGEYVDIAVIPGETKAKDVVVIVWYDATNNKLMYSYKVNPCNDNDGGTNEGTEGYWAAPKVIASNAGDYCKVAVDANGGVHIAAYDNLNADLIYAYLSSYSVATPQVVTVDAYAITGTEITIDAALDSTGDYVEPYIGYYAGSIQKPMIATLKKTIPVSGTTTVKSGVDKSNDTFTTDWEVSVVPTSSRMRNDHINVAVWKDADGKIKNSVHTDDNSYSSNEGAVYGNGTANPVMGYAIRKATTGYLETAQMK